MMIMVMMMIIMIILWTEVELICTRNKHPKNSYVLPKFALPKKIVTKKDKYK